MVYGTYNYSVYGVYKPSYNWGAPPCTPGELIFAVPWIQRNAETQRKRHTCAAEEKDGARDQNQLQEDGTYQPWEDPRQVGSLQQIGIACWISTKKRGQILEEIPIYFMRKSHIEEIPIYFHGRWMYH